MAIKAGELLHVGNSVLLDRLQTAGPGNLTINTEKINELGNYNSIATVRDTPDLVFNGESLDASAELESLLRGTDFETDAAGTEYDMSKPLCLDIVSQFKAGKDAALPFQVVASVAMPYLYLESLSYRFGIQDNANQSFSLRGDSIFMSSASAYIQEAVGTALASQVVTFAQAPIVYEGDSTAGDRYALSVVIAETGRRLVPGVDYNETTTAVTIIAAVPVTETIRIVYQSATAANYPDASHAAVSAVRPAALKGRDIEVRVGGDLITDRWSAIQNVTVEWRAQLEKDEELGNQQAIGQDFDVPEVNGTIEIRPRDAVALIDRVKQITGVTGNKVVGALQSVPLPIQIMLHSPDDGTTLKTLYVPDARFTLPGYSGQVEQKLNVTLNFESDGGILKVYKGDRDSGGSGSGS